MKNTFDCGKAYSYGYSKLDNLTNGLYPGELVLVGARPGMGTSSFILHSVLHWINTYKCSAAVFLYGHSTDEYRNRFSIVSSGRKAEAETDLLISEFRNFRYMHWLDSIKALFESEKRPGLIVIDSVRLMNYCDNNEQGTAVDFGNFFVRLKDIAEEYSVPVIVAVKLPRICDIRFDNGGDARPVLSDLSVTSVAVKDFDTVLMLYRDSYYNWEKYIGDSACATEIIVTKSLCGKNGICRLKHGYTAVF